MTTVSVPGRARCCASMSTSAGLSCPAATTGCTRVTIIGITAKGFDRHTTSASVPGLITCAESWLKPAAIEVCPDSGPDEGINTPAGRKIGLT